MPVYEYACEACDHVTEAIRPMRDADAKLACEACGSEKTHRSLSVFQAGASSRSSAPAMPVGGCGRCGDPRGACGLN